MTKRLDIFDHLVGEPSDRFLRKRAGYLYTSTMWRMVTPWSKPADVSGEIECKPEAGTVWGGGACACACAPRKGD